TFAAIRKLAAEDSRIAGLRLSRNSGSHIALTCGVNAAKGECCILLAADMQDPPETVSRLIERWRAGAQVVWAVRAKREGEKKSTLLFSQLFYWIMRKVVGMKDMPANGADFFLMDRRVAQAFCEFRETNISLQALITWMGFRQESIEYVKQARLYGVTGWNMGKKFKLVVDSVTSFSYAPIRLMSVGGFFLAFLGFLYAAYIVFHALTGKPVSGWSSIMVMVLVVGGFQILLMGVLGEYIWRTLDETRRRPRFMIEDATKPPEAIERTA